MAEAAAGFLAGLPGSGFILIPITYFLEEVGENQPDLEELLFFSL